MGQKGPRPVRGNLSRPPGIRITNLGLAASRLELSRGLGLMLVDEEDGARDRNGDGDQDDVVPAVLVRETGQLLVLPLSLGQSFFSAKYVLDDFRLVFGVMETDQGQDLDGNGVLSGKVLHVFDAQTATTTNLGIAAEDLDFEDPYVAYEVFQVPGNPIRVRNLDTGDDVFVETGSSPQIRDGWLQLRVFERAADLNGDGDTFDVVPFVYRLGSGLPAVNCGVALSGGVFSDGGYFAFGVPEKSQGGVDLTGDGDTNDDLLYVYDAEAQELTYTGYWNNLLLDFSPIHPLREGVFAWIVGEHSRGVDLNGDGDRLDAFPLLYDVVRGDAQRLPYAMSAPGSHESWSAERFFYIALENLQSEDLNGDGDTFDAVPVTVDLDSRTLSLSSLASALQGGVAPGGDPYFLASEAFSGTDLNGDGDLADDVLHVNTARGEVNLRTNGYTILNTGPSNNDGAGTRALFFTMEETDRDLNGDGDTSDFVPHVVDRTTWTIQSVGIAASLSLYSSRPVNGAWLLVVEEDEQGGTDLNGDGDTDDPVAHLVELVF